MRIHQSSSDAFVVYDSLLARALDVVETFAGEVLFDKKRPTSTKPDAILGDIVGNFEDEQYQMRVYEQEYTQTDMDEFDRMAGCRP